MKLRDSFGHFRNLNDLIKRIQGAIMKLWETDLGIGTSTLTHRRYSFPSP